MNAPAAVAAGLAPSQSELEWQQISAQAPKLAATSARYLEQIALSLRPASVVLADASLRFFCRYLVEEHPKTKSFEMVGRGEIEGYKANLARRITAQGRLVSPNYRRQRLGMLRTFFDRIIEWGWDDAPPRCPIFTSDLPKPDEPLPKFLDDADAPSTTACSATAGARDRSSSTAASRPCARGAGSSPPRWSSRTP